MRRFAATRAPYCTNITFALDSFLWSRSPWMVIRRTCFIHLATSSLYCDLSLIFDARFVVWFITFVLRRPHYLKHTGLLVLRSLITRQTFELALDFKSLSNSWALPPTFVPFDLSAYSMTPPWRCNFWNGFRNLIHFMSKFQTLIFCIYSWHSLRIFLLFIFMKETTLSQIPNFLASFADNHLSSGGSRCSLICSSVRPVHFL